MLNFSWTDFSPIFGKVSEAKVKVSEKELNDSNEA